MAIYHHTTRMIGRSNGGNPVKTIAYISGIQITDPNTGEVFDFQDKSVQDVQILLPENAPAWAKEIQQLVSTDREKGIQLLSNIANAAEKRVDAQVYREIEFSLPRELTYEQRKALAQEYVQDQFCGLGMLAIQSFHVETCEETGELNPHCHTFFLTRELVEGNSSQGLVSKKNRDWNTREVHEVWREQWAQYASFHLKMHGFDITLDHRSYKDQGLDIEPQVKLGKGVNEQEKRTDGIEGCSLSKNQENAEDIGGFVASTPTTKRTQAFREVQLRNLYRIMRRPETVLDIVTRHHATFMWGDVQKILGRYVDDSTLFQRLDARLQNSKELILLKGNGEQAIYTTHTMLKAEKKLVGTAEMLAGHESHSVSSASLEDGLERLKTGLAQEGHTLSEGQEQAIRHLVDEGQLKCIVGYAGAGKTTALEACHDIWEDAGYKVYGLAPTGRAAQNLEGSGIKSQTLHKFLKSFEEGRCQYNERSIFILDEAGMVDVERFDKFLGAVQTLGIKAVVVGDGAQLQPVEAGPAFRLVTERVGVSRLEEIVRQKEDWQKEATVLFGQQESQKAIQTYQDKGHVHLVDEHIPTDVVTRYEMAARASGLIFREIMREVKGSYPTEPSLASQHEDYDLFLKWKECQKTAGKEILANPEVYKPVLESRNIDPLEMARLFVNKKQTKKLQYDEAASILKEKGLGHLIGLEKLPGQTIEVRSGAKAAMIEDWKQNLQDSPEKSLLMMAYSNRDVRDLNVQARTYLKEVGVLDKKDFAHTIHREVEDDFGRKKIFKEERVFSKGDKLVFARNNAGLGVKNGTIGTITEINAQKIEVKIADDQKVSFAPNLNPYFDQGWAVTIHKSQGTTVDKSFLLASHEMTQNLTYVAMTRHRDSVQVYGSTLDFWRDEKLPSVLSKSGEKLGAADYLDANSLAKLMKEEDRLLTKLFTRLGDELHAMGAVSKQAFKNVADYFLGRTSEKSILLKPETVREEARAQEILQKGPVSLRTEIKTVHDVQGDMKHPAFHEADFYKRVYAKGLKTQGEAASIEYWKEKSEPYRQVFEQKMETVEQALQSPLLSYMSDKAKNLARKAAFEDPDKTIKFLCDLQDIKKAKHDAHAQALQAKEAALKLQAQQEQRRQESLKNGLSHYYRFKDLNYELEKKYDSDLEKERADLSKSLYKNKEVYEHIQKIDPEMSQTIKQLAQEKQLQQKIREMDRGGMSL
ncbi:MAG: AAA family ATPase [Alphaproteobacteria bacterium]|nr:AAA family ATPase [Alphaproteobacteria bacterium]